MTQRFSWKKRRRSFLYAFKGIAHTIRTQHNFRIQIVLMLFAILLGAVFNIEQHEWLAIAVVSGLVLSFEIANTVVETFLDEHYPEPNKKTGLIKDLAAGAVLMASIAALVVGLLIFIPKIFTI